MLALLSALLLRGSLQGSKVQSDADRAKGCWLVVRQDFWPVDAGSAEIMRADATGDPSAAFTKAGYRTELEGKIHFAFSSGVWEESAAEADSSALHELQDSIQRDGRITRLSIVAGACLEAAFDGAGFQFADFHQVTASVKWQFGLEIPGEVPPIHVNLNLLVGGAPTSLEPTLKLAQAGVSAQEDLIFRRTTIYFFTLLDGNSNSPDLKLSSAAEQLARHQAIDRLEANYDDIEARLDRARAPIIAKLGEVRTAQLIGKRLAELPAPQQKWLRKAAGKQFDAMGFASAEEAVDFVARATIVSAAPRLVLSANYLPAGSAPPHLVTVDGP